jgi:hypothetical protein
MAIYTSDGGYYNELDFLTHIPILKNDDNLDSIYNDVRGITVNGKGEITKRTNSSRCVVFKNKNTQGTNKIKDYYRDNVYKSNDNDANPYLKLIKDFNSLNIESLKLKAANFAYLKDLGVYPLNRMWILRRFPEGTIVSNNLQEVNTSPISTVIGWIGFDKDEFFSVSFNEEWQLMTDRLDQVLVKMVEEEFGLKLGGAVSVPGWSQGLLFGFLKSMGLTDYDLNNIPQGDPNVLGEALTRGKDGKVDYGLNSDITISLETSYEQKFIGDIDSGLALLDIIYNLLTMGTSNVQYVLKDPSKSEIINKLLNAANQRNDVNAWWDLIKEMVTKFIGAVGEIFKGVASNASSVLNQNNNEKSKTPPSVNNVTGAATNTLNLISGAATGLLKTVLSSTVAKWRWALRSSVSLMTGISSTPWHITLGNPYSPFFSMSNLHVQKVTLKFNNEFAYNDMPTQINVSIQVNMGRGMGLQEIFKTFNNGFFRIYDINTGDSVDNDTKNTAQKGEQASTLGNVNQNPNLP